ncbi:MAG: c-type cytochrome [Pseudorhodoplanes sp.]|jgi:cytochrome c
MRRIAISAAALLALAASAFQAQAQGAQRGVVLARTYCVKCHSIDKLSPSPLTIAPPFRDLHKKYPVEQLQEALAEGMVTGHPTMPEFRFDPGQVNDFIAFLKTLE